MTIDELAARMEEQFKGVNDRFTGVDQKFIGLDQRFDGLEKRFDSLEKKVDDGLNDSKIRDEELRDLMKCGLDAREVLRDEMHRRFDEGERKQDEQLTLLKDALRHVDNAS